MSDSLRPHGLQHARLPCLSPTSGVCSTIELVMLSNHIILCHPLLLLLQSFPASRSFPMSQFFASGGQSTGASASASVLPMNVQDWFPLRLTGLISKMSISIIGGQDINLWMGRGRGTNIQTWASWLHMLVVWSKTCLVYDYMWLSFLNWGNEHKMRTKITPTSWRCSKD